MSSRVLLSLLLLVLLALGLERALGQRELAAPQVVQDEGGRKLFILILDSLRAEDAADLRSLRAVAKKGFSAEVEPCMERVTYLCVRDALTGRSAFSLFGLFRNFGVGATDPGHNLLRDARAAGKIVAVVSAGDLKPFYVDADIHEEFPVKYTTEERAAAVSYTEGADLVLYHYIWHDADSHHYDVGTAGYEDSLERLDRLVTRIRRGLPPDWDLLITGDHGHDPTGQHVQGQDIPTAVYLLSPNIRPIRPDGRIPISAVRFLAGASMGLYSNQGEHPPEWEDWLSVRVGKEARALVRAGGGVPAPGFPGLAVLVIAVATALSALRWPRLVPVAAVLGAAVMGVTFPAWLEAMHFLPPKTPRVNERFFLVPGLGWLAGLLATRSWVGGWRWAARVGAGCMVLLYPVLHHYGLLKNADWIVDVILLAAACSALRWWWPDRPWRRLLPVAGLAALCVWGWSYLTWTRVFNFEITAFHAATWVKGSPALATLITAGLAGLVQAAIERDPRWAAAGSGAFLAGWLLLKLPALVFAPAVAALIALAFAGRIPHRSRALSLVFAVSAPFLFTAGEAFGLYVCLAVLGASLALLERVWSEEEGRLSAAILAALAGYLLLAWGFGLQVSGIDFTFMVKWLPPGRLHERLWWLIAIATLVKYVAPALIAGILCQRRLPGRGALPLAVDLALLRALTSAAFATAWLASAGTAATGARLASVVQDALWWLLVALALAHAKERER